jgi:hypothetical protein
MAKTYRALKDMRYPADEKSLRAAKEKRFKDVEWVDVEKGTEDLVPYCPEILASWKANKAVEEMKSR